MSEDDLREEILKTRALRDMDTNSSIKNIVCETEFVFDFKAKWNNGAATMGGPNYRSVSREWSLTKDEASKLKNASDISSWVNDNKEEVADEMMFSRYKNVKGNVHPKVNLYYLIKFLDGDETWLRKTKRIDSTDYFDPIAPFAFSDREVFVEPSSERSVVKLGQTQFELPVEKPETQEQSQLDNIIKDYLSKSSLSVKCNISQVREVDDELKVRLETENGYSYNINFTDPTDNRSPVWDLTTEFDYSDPWNLEGETAYYTMSPIGGSDSYRSMYINISSDKISQGKLEKTRIGFIDRIRSLLNR